MKKKITKKLSYRDAGVDIDTIENIPRILPDGCAVMLEISKWNVPKIFNIIQDVGNIADQEMFRVFNMGIGLALIVSKSDVKTVLNDLKSATEPGRVIGEVVRGDRAVRIV